MHGTFALGFGSYIILYKAICNPDNVKLNPNTMTYPLEIVENYPYLLIFTMTLIIILGLLTFFMLY